MEPDFRCGTGEAIAELSAKLNIPFDPTMQDWSYTEGRPEDIERYLTLYSKIEDGDQKFVLMELIIQATEDQPSSDFFAKYCQQIRPILEQEFSLHAYSIHYWACFDNEDLEDCWKISPLMREIWASDFNPIV